MSDRGDARTPRGASSSIGRRTRVVGELSGKGSLLVEGWVSGGIRLTGGVHVAAGATVEGQVQAETVAIDGTLEGEVTALDGITIGDSAQVRGKLHTTRLSVEPGATLSVDLVSSFELRHVAPSSRRELHAERALEAE